jgi:hypothetical protein
VDHGVVTENSKNLQEPQNHNNNHNDIQNRLYGPSHWDEPVDEPQDKTNHDKDYYHMN